MKSLIKYELNIFQKIFSLNNKKRYPKISLKGKTLNNQLVTRTGFEPIHACVKGMCVKPFHQRAMYLNKSGE